MAVRGARVVGRRALAWVATGALVVLTVGLALRRDHDARGSEPVSPPASTRATVASEPVPDVGRGGGAVRRATDAEFVAAGPFGAASRRGDVFSYDVYRDGRHPPGGSPLRFPGLSPRAAAALSVTDLDGFGGGFYVATCCDPMLWHNDERFVAGARIDIFPVGLARGIVDPASSTAWLDDRRVSEPGVVDVAWIGRGNVALLIGSAQPSLVLYSFTERDATGEPTRRVVSLPPSTAGACAAVGAAGQLAVLVGRSVGADACVATTMLVIDPVSGATRATFELPVAVRGINSDHVSRLIAVTVEGSVIFAASLQSPDWITLLDDGDYVAARLY